MLNAVNNLYNGVVFNHGLTNACTVISCFFFEIKERIINCNDGSSNKIEFQKNICVSSGISDKSQRGGIINIISSNGRFICDESIFNSCPIVDQGIFIAARCNIINISFLDFYQNSNALSGHMALHFNINRGIIKFINISYTRSISTGNAGLQPETGLDSIKYVQTVNCQGSELFRAGFSFNPIISKLIFANCTSSMGIISLYYGQLTIFDAVFANIDAPIITDDSVLSGKKNVTLTLENPIFFGFPSIQRHSSLTINSETIAIKEPTTITRLLVLKNVFETPVKAGLMMRYMALVMGFICKGTASKL